ncbi:MAG: hypothetical protein JWN55_603 [Frankiales bacterium]|nr:hypothetical protein [Frankiales bacterium]
MTTVEISSDVRHSGAVDVLGSTSAVPSRAGALTARFSRPVRRWASALRAVPHVATYAGLALTLAGGVLLLVAWGKTAGLTNVALQVPFLVSAGCTGLGLVAVGLTVVNLAAKHEDAVRRRAQVSELQELLAALRRALEADAPEGKR